MSSVGKLVVELGASIAKFQADLGKATAIAEQHAKKIDNAFGGLRNRLLAIGGTLGVVTSVGAVFDKFKGALDAADHLQDLSERTGIAVESLNGLDYAFTLAGASSEDLETGLKKLSKAISEAGTGDKKLKQLFKDLGLEDASKGLGSTEDALIKLADAFPRLSDADKTRVSMELLSKSGERLIPALNGGSDALREMIKEGQALNPISGDLAKKANEFNDTLQKISTVAKGALLPALEAILPTMQKMADRFLDARKAGLGFFESLNKAQGVTRSLIGLSDPFESASEQIQKINGELTELQKLKDGGVLPNGEVEDTARIDSRIEHLKKLTSYFKAQQKREEIAVAPKASPAVVAKIKLSGEDTSKDELSKRLKGLDVAIDAEKDLLKSREDFLQLYYQNDNLSINEYFDKRNEVIRDSLNKTVGLYDQEISALRAAAAKAEPKDQIEINTKLIDIIGKKSKVETEAAQNAAKLFFEQNKAAQDYQDKLTGITAQIKELNGDTKGAAELKFDTSNRELIKRLQAEGNSDAEDQLKKIKARTVSQAELNDIQRQFSLITDELAVKEGHIDLERKKGATSELENLDQLSKARQGSIADLTKLVSQYEAVAIASGDPQAVLAAEQLRLKLDELAASSDLIGDKFGTLFEDSFSTFFADTLDGTKSISGAFDDMAGNIRKTVDKLVAEELGKKLFGFVKDQAGGLFGGAGGAGGGGGAGIIGTIAGLFGFANGGVMTSAGSMPLNKYASGGIANSPQLALFGEGRSPEAYVPLPDGRSIPVSMKGGGGGTTVVVNQSFAPGTDKRTIDQAALAVSRTTQRSVRRNG